MTLFLDPRKCPQEPQPEVNEVGDQLENVQLSNAQNISERLQMESVLGECHINMYMVQLLPNFQISQC